MLKLQMLGSLDLLDAGRDISPVLRRPKSLALLAYLAAARPRGFHRRDTLLALFWPDLDQAHARNALRQTVHSLRHELGGHVLIGRGEEELGVDSARLWCDVAQFDAHLDGHDLKAAVALYRGELLHGFHVSGANEFEAWQDQERKYLAKRARSDGYSDSSITSVVGRMRFANTKNLPTAWHSISKSIPHRKHAR